MLKRGPYMTKKRKHKFESTYQMIDELKEHILNMEIEMGTHIKYKRFDEVESLKRYIKKFKQYLQEYKKDGWLID